MTPARTPPRTPRRRERLPASDGRAGLGHGRAAGRSDPRSRSPATPARRPGPGRPRPDPCPAASAQESRRRGDLGRKLAAAAAGAAGLGRGWSPGNCGPGAGPAAAPGSRVWGEPRRPGACQSVSRQGSSRVGSPGRGGVYLRSPASVTASREGPGVKSGPWGWRSRLSPPGGHHLWGSRQREGLRPYSPHPALFYLLFANLSRPQSLPRALHLIRELDKIRYVIRF